MSAQVLTESKWTEFKASYSPGLIIMYMKCINAFMNTDGGSMWFGISDGGAKVGMSMTTKQEDILKLDFDKLEKRFFPRFLGTIKIHVDRDPLKRHNNCIVQVEVVRGEHDHPTYYSYYGGNAFRRLNASNTYFDKTDFVETSQLFQLQSRVAELEELMPDNKREYTDLERHINENLSIKSAKRFVDTLKVYSSLDEQMLETVKIKDEYIKELKHAELQALKHASIQDQENQKLREQLSKQDRIMAVMRQKIKVTL